MAADGDAARIATTVATCHPVTITVPKSIQQQWSQQTSMVPSSLLQILLFVPHIDTVAAVINAPQSNAAGISASNLIATNILSPASAINVHKLMDGIGERDKLYLGMC